VVHACILKSKDDDLSLGWYYILDVPAFELNGSIFNVFTRVVLTTRCEYAANCGPCGQGY
jgi:hypothetical protein